MKPALHLLTLVVLLPGFCRATGWDGAAGIADAALAKLAAQSSHPSVRIEPLKSALDLSIHETFERGKPGLKPFLALVYKNQVNDNRYSLKATESVSGSSIGIVIDGLAVRTGGIFMDGVPDPRLNYPLPDQAGTYQVSVTYAGRADTYTLTISADRFSLRPASVLQVTTAPQHEYLRVPAHSLWVDIGTSDRAAFTQKIQDFRDGMRAIGAAEFTAQQGVYAFGGFWGMASAEADKPNANGYMSGNYCDDFLYFTYSGPLKNVEDVVRQFKADQCESGKPACMMISVESWTGERIGSWLL